MTTDYGTAPAPAPRSTRTNVLAIISLIAGIIALPFFCCWPVSIPLGLVAIVLGAIAVNQIKATAEGGRGLAIAGIVLGAAAILLFVLLVVIAGVVDPEALQQRIQQQQGIEQPDEDIVIPVEPEGELGPAEDAVPDAVPEPAGE